MDIFIYSDASFSKEHKLAVLGHMIFFNKTEHEDSQSRRDFVTLVETSEINNIRAELKGAIRALKDCLQFIEEKSAPINTPVKLYTDCQTVSGLLARRQKLQTTHFISQRKNQELPNKDLYSDFYSMCDLLRPEIIWVKGHTVKEQRTAITQNFSILDKAVRFRLREILR